jgi:hypothetical protein
MGWELTGARAARRSPTRRRLRGCSLRRLTHCTASLSCFTRQTPQPPPARHAHGSALSTAPDTPPPHATARDVFRARRSSSRRSESSPASQTKLAARSFRLGAFPAVWPGAVRRFGLSAPKVNTQTFSLRSANTSGSARHNSRSQKPVLGLTEVGGWYDLTSRYARDCCAYIRS